MKSLGMMRRREKEGGRVCVSKRIRERRNEERNEDK